MKTRIELDLQRLKGSQVRPLEDVGSYFGFNLDYLTNDVTNYWLKKYDWKKQQAMLNSFPQYKTKIDGMSYCVQARNSSFSSLKSSFLRLKSSILRSKSSF